ncbi:Branched-chain-amino-acid aminotransferase, partial [Haemophilus influenzae]
QKSV